MSSLFYFFKESLTGFTRNLSTTLGSIITIFLSLLIIGIFLVGGLIVDNTVKSVEDKVSITAYVSDDAEQSDIDTVMKAIEKMVAARTKDLRPEERSKVLFLFRYDARQIVTSGRNFFGQYWCDAVGARNVAESVTADNANAIVSMEQIYAWNPDVVFITNFTAATPADLFDNKMAGHDWSDVKAVKDKRVYKLPLGIYRSYTPSADTPLTLLWIAKQVYPSRFADIDLTKEVKAWYKDVFGVTLTDADVDMMFNPGEGASTGATVATRSNG